MGILANGTFSANGTSAEVESTSGKFFIQGGNNFGGGALSFEIAIDGMDFSTINAECILTAPGAFSVTVPINTKGRLVLTGSTTPDLDYVISNG